MLLVVANVADPDPSAEAPEHAVVSFASNGLERFNLFPQIIVAEGGSVDLRSQHSELASDLL